MVHVSINARVNTLPPSRVPCYRSTNPVTTIFFSKVLKAHFACLVPVYDGRKDLVLAKYWNKLYDRDLEVGTTVSLLFSIKKGTLPANARNFRRSEEMVGVYVNILVVIVLEDPTDAFCIDTSPVPETVHGVDDLPQLPEGEVEGDAKEDDNEDEIAEGVEIF